MTGGVLTAVLYAIPGLVWAVIAETAWRDRHARRSRAPVSLAIVSGLMALHFFFGMGSELVETDLAWRAPGLRHGLDVAGTIAIVVAIAVFADRGFLWTPTETEPRGRTWRVLNVATCATVLVVVAAEHVVPSAARWLTWLYAVIVTFGYLIVMTVIMLLRMRGRMRRGGWEPGGLAAPRSVDLALVTGGVAVLAVTGGLVLASFGLGLSQGATWTLRVLHVTVALAVAAVPAVRILGDVVRGVALTLGLATGASIVHVGGHALTAGLPAEAARLIDAGAIVLLVVIGGPGRTWLRAAIERIVFHRDVRQAELQELVRTLAPDAGSLACCRDALAAIARVMQLSGAAVVLRDGDVAVHDAFAIEPIARVWPRGGTTYLCAVDDDRNAISMIQSLFEGFGSGVVAGDTGIALHSRGAGFTEEEGHPNQLAPGRRPFHTLMPGLMLADGGLLGPFGVMGAAMQAQAHFQVVRRVVDDGLDPQAALDAARFRATGGRAVTIEPGLAGQADDLRARGHDVNVAAVPHAFGVGQMILVEGGALVGGSDGRADGQAAGL